MYDDRLNFSLNDLILSEDKLLEFKKGKGRDRKES